VFDLSRAAAAAPLEAGASWPGDLSDLAGRSDVVMLSLPGPKEVEAVVAGLAGHLRPGSILVDFSTNSVALVKRLHGLLAERGVAMLDAPVSGATAGARAGTLAIWVGGEVAAYTRVEPLLKALGDKLMHVGEIGAGSIAKLVHNQISLTRNMVLAEGFSLGVKAGIEPRTLLKAISAGVLGRPDSLNILPRVVFKGDFDNAQFALELARKDLLLAAELGRDLNVPMPLAAQFREQMEAAMAKGWGGRDSSALFALQEEAAGVEIRAAGAD
jgi:3-hydroxyisobutyrate dehydrogenase